ncbi:hypothetical protein F2Q70_00027106, partial [Brassica cretica]
MDGVGLSMYTMWNSTRSTLIVPGFRCLVALCLIISLLVSIESVYMNLVILYVKMFDRKPEKVYKWEEMQKDMELGHQNYPVVLIQIPMYNEREVLNANTCLLTRMQEMSLNYHFMAEQQSGSTRHAFFGFNGTAGVWRIAAMEEAGGWKDRTTVEDMDLAVRVGLLGWKFVFINDVE